jgi:hypothetical protein
MLGVLNLGKLGSWVRLHIEMDWLSYHGSMLNRLSEK